MKPSLDDLVDALVKIGRVISDISAGNIGTALDHVEEAVRAAQKVGCASDEEVAASNRCVDADVLRRVLECLNSKLPNPVARRSKM